MALADYEGMIHRCFRCGYCKFTSDYSYVGFNCPMYNKVRLESYSPGGLMWLIHAALVKEKLKPSKHLSEILYSCTLCRNCSEECRFQFHEDIVHVLKAAREAMVEKQLVPPMVSQFLKNVYDYGNPYRELKENRGHWAENTGIRQYEKGDEFLYYVGCVGSYDTVSQKAARALGRVLLKSGLSFGILGSREICDGNEVDMLGEKGLFEFLKEENTRTFKELGVKKIVTLSPHSYHALKNSYSDEFEVFHYTQLFRDLIKSGALDVSGGFRTKVTYHDPCFLGRYNHEYDAPREILTAIPGIELIEMERAKENAFCCGGGGGNFYTDILGGGESTPSRIRVMEARETGAKILAVSCPVCMMMLEDALKAEGLENELAIKDIAEIMDAVCGDSGA
ncbi:MAG: (Fe-S)-binding protein [Syntrophales bacterium]|nr:(Fe-S)-binding protein [Syntrophales bacterium]HPB70205.1 (Fe-S)-binding protein [Syntrophales bacterium]HQN25996.1 (Fe-S)-binding protein [Syntrophales bacterium]